MKREIYVIEPGQYSEEVIATAFAMASRIPGSIRDSLEKLTEEKSAAFHEKWVVGYGHSSVAEHGVVHLAMEDVSRLATDAIEGNRLASYTEKSTRFQTIGSDQVYKPEDVMRSRWAEDFERVHEMLFSAYAVGLTAVGREVKENIYPAKPDESPAKHEARVGTIYRDICRSGLPFSVLARLGMTANARTWEYALSKWLSHPLREVREIGQEAKEQVLRATPTLVKYARRSPYLVETREAMKAEVEKEWNGEERELCVEPSVEVVTVDPEGERKFLTAWMYKLGSGRSYAECWEKVGSMDEERQQVLIGQALSRMGEFDSPGRELELPVVAFDCLLDAGSYNDYKRNRMMTQIAQVFDGAYGFKLPQILYGGGVGEQMAGAIREAHDLAEAMRPEFQGEDQYLLTNATLRRLLMQMNLREMVTFKKTRGAGNTNPGYRWMALKMGEITEKAYPNIWKWMKTKGGDGYPSGDDIYERYFVKGETGR